MTSWCTAHSREPTVFSSTELGVASAAGRQCTRSRVANLPIRSRFLGSIARFLSAVATARTTGSLDMRSSSTRIGRPFSFLTVERRITAHWGDRKLPITPCSHKHGLLLLHIAYWKRGNTFGPHVHWSAFIAQEPKSMKSELHTTQVGRVFPS